MHGRLNELQDQRTVEHRLVRQLSEHTLTGLLAPPPLAAPPLRCGLLADMTEEEGAQMNKCSEKSTDGGGSRHSTLLQRGYAYSKGEDTQ